MNNILNAGIIGIGQIGYNIKNDKNRDIIWSHYSAYKKSKLTKLISVCDINQEQLNKFKRENKEITTYSSLERFLTNNDLDIVSICTPENVNGDIFDTIFKFKNKIKAIFCEKPLASNVKEAKYINDKCKKNDILLAVNYMRRWQSTYKQIYNIIEECKYGKLQNITCYGSTSLLTSASHLIDILLWYGGKPKWLVGSIQDDYIRTVRGEPDVGGIGLVKFKSNKFGYLKALSKCEKNYMFELDILFQDGRIKVENDGLNVNYFKFKKIKSHVGKGYSTLVKTKDPLNENKEERLLNAIENIHDSIHNESTIQSNGDNAIDVLYFIELLKKSSKNTRLIKWNN
jgi:predicted dehydrogenase